MLLRWRWNRVSQLSAPHRRETVSTNNMDHFEAPTSVYTSPKKSINLSSCSIFAPSSFSSSNYTSHFSLALVQHNTSFNNDFVSIDPTNGSLRPNWQTLYMDRLYISLRDPGINQDSSKVPDPGWPRVWPRRCPPPLVRESNKRNSLYRICWKIYRLWLGARRLPWLIIF